MSRILAIDYGMKRVGLAVTDPLKIIANPLKTVEEKGLMAFLSEYVSREDVDTIVVGKPSRMDGRATHASGPVSKMVEVLRKKFPEVRIVEVDERFTSLMARRTLVDMGMKKKDREIKGNTDQVSATIILQTYLEMIK